MVRDDEVFAEGEYSFRMTRQRKQVFGLFSQTLNADHLAGDSLSYSALLRTAGVGKRGWMLVVNFLGPSSGILRQERSERLSGDSDWRRVAIEAEVPPGTRQILVGVMLLDEGTGWMDAARLTLGTPEENAPAASEVEGKEEASDDGEDASVEAGDAPSSEAGEAGDGDATTA